MVRKLTLRRFFQRTLPVLAVLMLLFAALYLAADATRGVSGFSDYYVWVFALVGLGLLVLAVIIFQRILRLVRQLRSEAPGARLTLRMVLLFIALVLPPAVVVYGFSVTFINNSIDSWFDVEVESALDDALTISQEFLKVQEVSAQSQVRQLARRLENISDTRTRSLLRDMLQETRAVEFTVLNRSGQVLATAARGLASLQPDLPPEFLLVRAVRSGSYVAAEPVAEGVLQIRVLTEISDEGFRSEARILQAIYPVTQGFDKQQDNVERQHQRYDTLKYLRTQLKRAFILILSLVLLLSVLMAVLLAFNTARRLVSPIGRLAEATREIAAGEYHRRLPVPSRDDLGFLVSSFNTMTEEIDRSTNQATAAREEAEQRRDYLEAVLGRLSSGVLSFDHQGCLLTANPAAAQVLGLDLHARLHRPFAEVTEDNPQLAPLTQMVADHLVGDGRDWRQELVLERPDGQQVLMCRGAVLHGESDAGHVLVFDDMTDLVRAQREAAWGEVARRLAHEVKNPLTPIQLAAERLRHKYLGSMPEEDAEVLDRATLTIASQVEALKTMVNAFSEYARAPTLQLEPSRLSDLVEEVLDLYQHSDARVDINSTWMSDEPRVLADRGRIRQLLHNLIKNAQEALDGEPLSLHLRTESKESAGQIWLALRMRDNGPGLPAEIGNKLFEPYATTKNRGTGVGLAIVKKIAEEHGGDIQAHNAEEGGAVFVLRLPVARP
jgi:nitrogen fixation/metabolism regulation signal transduction histidine kinase